ncbi:hypothetical protein [Pseudomonas chlororaphis]|uniref:hypothetical protein n=1 Tax=Pseudomonas chlororaphis TaxID=587753 RepID=UPI0015DE58B0|nr:hypothetical protein [Pseudomonas chlororaphis]QLL13454.1 hypothetical protein H0I86_31595 [Pseudomonas chlororaphis subsp. aurantiaca]
MSINLDSAARLHGQWANTGEADRSKTANERVGGQPPVSANANGQILEDQLDQLKELASNDRVAPMFEGGALATLEKLMIMLREMQSKTRDMWREFAANQQQTAHTMRITAYETRMESIEQNYNAAMTQGFSQILSGIVNVGGAITGNQLVTTGTTGFGKASEGFGTMISASQTREAQINQAIAEFQQGNADEFRKTLESAVEKASEASRQMREWLKELGDLQSRIMSAVRL